MAIEPDTEDWTWVLERPCPECGFDASQVQRGEVARIVRDNVAEWPAVLERDGVTVRSVPDRWSALEYACHVRDVFSLFLERLTLMLADDDAHFANWDQDATAVERRYAEQNPTIVSAELTQAGLALAEAFDDVHGDQWERTGVRSDGATFTVESFGRYLIHDPVHHLWDVGIPGA